MLKVFSQTEPGYSFSGQDYCLSEKLLACIRLVVSIEKTPVEVETHCVTSDKYDDFLSCPYKAKTYKQGSRNSLP